MLEILKYAFSAAVGKPPTWEEERYRFFRAVKNGDVETMRKTAQKYPDCVAWTSARGAPLAVAIGSGRKMALEALLGLDADVNAECGPEQSPPLHLAVEKGRCDLAGLLIDAGARLDQCDHKTFSRHIYHWRTASTPLGVAIRKKNKPMVALLAEKGANLNAVCFTQSVEDLPTTSTPEQYARSLKQFELADFIAMLARAKNAAPAAPAAPAMNLQTPLTVSAPLRLRLKGAAQPTELKI